MRRGSVPGWNVRRGSLRWVPSDTGVHIRVRFRVQVKLGAGVGSDLGGDRCGGAVQVIGAGD